MKEFLYELDNLTWKEWYRFGKDPETALSNILDSENVFFTVGKLENKIISLAYLDRIDLKKKNARLGIVVHPEFRGKGVGSAHIKYLLEMARKKNLEKVSLSVNSRNRPAFRLYKKFGWKVVKFFKDNPTRCEMVLNLREEINEKNSS